MLEVITIIILLIVALIAYLINRSIDQNIMDFDSAVEKTRTRNVKEKQGSALSCLMGYSGKRKIEIPINGNHVYICGTTGTGKTVAIANFIECGVNNDFPMLIIDGKGDKNNGSMLDIIQQLKKDKKFYIVDMNSPEESDKYNPFCNTSPTVIKDMLVNLTDWTEPHYKLNTERYLQRVIALLDNAELPLSIKSIVEHMSIDSFTKLSGQLQKQDVLSKEEHLHNITLAKESGNIAQGAIARFSTILEGEVGEIFSDDGIDIYTALQEKAIILFILNPLEYPELSTLFGKLIVIDSKKAVAKIYGNHLGKVLFIMDEINVYASTSLLDLVNKSRSGDVTCVLASQSLSDLEASTDAGVSFKEQVIENCNNYLVLRQNSATNAEMWANIIGTRPSMAVTYQLGTKDHVTSSTGAGTAKLVREYYYHPDDIKALAKGRAYYINKDANTRTKVAIKKPF